MWYALLAPLAAAVRVGDQVPAFRATTHLGRTVTDASFRGRGLVLWEGENFESLARNFSDLGYGIAGCSTDDVDFNLKFATDHSFSFPLISDPNARVVEAFGACKRTDCSSAARMTFVISRRGHLLHIDPKFDPDNGPRNLLDLIAKMQRRAHGAVRHRASLFRI
ncbi:hypothetical protein CTAYLR_001406 [Chrysophaeum taylorii]|uniref:Alkyl hydroperoxide reductase subunit C/ Thiol specific antioxidant domain-containing protein n=1 Tax=Chrysophaeum taylorii TaxID=2483200 RepID=A0AAD7XGF0_9STRA|nr:hypothetical protein CTAYLR_001406 [Chrysophaeum taylorii]